MYRGFTFARYGPTVRSATRPVTRDRPRRRELGLVLEFRAEVREDERRHRAVEGHVIALCTFVVRDVHALRAPGIHQRVHRSRRDQLVLRRLVDQHRVDRRLAGPRQIILRQRRENDWQIERVARVEVVGEMSCWIRRTIGRVADAAVLERIRCGDPLRVEIAVEQRGIRTVDADHHRESEREQRVAGAGVEVFEHCVDIGGRAARGNRDDVQFGRVGLAQRRRPRGRDRAAGIALHADGRLRVEPQRRKLLGRTDAVERDLPVQEPDRILGKRSEVVGIDQRPPLVEALERERPFRLARRVGGATRHRVGDRALRTERVLVVLHGKQRLRSAAERHRRLDDRGNRRNRIAMNVA